MYISSQRYFVQRFLDKGRQKGIDTLIAENQHTSMIIRKVDSGTLHKSVVYNEEIAASIAGGESQSQQDAMITLSEKECDLIDHNFNSNISHANASTLDLERMLKVSDGIVAPLLDIDHLLQEICVTIQEIVDRESQSKLSTAIIPRQETKKIVRQISKACIYEGACVAFLFAWIVKKKYILLGKSSEISLVIIVLSLYLIFVRNNVIAKVI